MSAQKKVYGLGTDNLAYLLDLARDKSVNAKEKLVEVVGDLFFDKDRVLTDHERALMTDILRRLIHDVEMTVRKKLADRLATQPDAPHDLIVTLANSEIEVAHTILLQSAVLHDDELIEIVRHRTLEHQLAIAMRRTISENVSDALVETGHKGVIETLLENSDATISRRTMEYLVEQSRHVDQYQNPLLRRPDLADTLAARMYWWVSAALREHIVTNFDVDPDVLDQTIEDTVKGSLESKAEPGDARLAGGDHGSAAMDLAQRLAETDAITPKLLIQALRQGEISLFQSMFAKLANIRILLVRRMMFEAGGEALAVACRAIDIEKPDFASIFLLSRKARPGDKTVDPSELTQALAMYDKAQKDGALKVLHRWQRDPQFIEAIGAVSGHIPGASKAAQ